jgi:hypothetical protein
VRDGNKDDAEGELSELNVCNGDETSSDESLTGCICTFCNCEMLLKIVYPF